MQPKLQPVSVHQVANPGLHDRLLPVLLPPGERQCLQPTRAKAHCLCMALNCMTSSEGDQTASATQLPRPCCARRAVQAGLCKLQARQQHKAAPKLLLCKQALQECQGRLKGLVQGMAAMQAELGELQAKQQHKAAQEQGRSGLLPALHGAAGRCVSYVHPRGALCLQAVGDSPPGCGASGPD